MSLLGLPNELILDIIQRCMPLGFESLMLSCKAVHTVGEEFIERHNSLRRTYRIVEPARRFDYAPENDAPQDILHLLHKIAKDPLTAGYIQSIDFTWDNPIGDYSEAIEKWPVLLDNETAIEDLRFLLSDPGTLARVGIDVSGWLERMVNEPEIFFCLNRINLGWVSAQEIALDKEAAAFLETIVMNARTDPSQPLAQVTSLKTGGQWDMGEGADFQVLNPFFVLPKLRKFRGSNFMPCDR
ncbi:uncharacterized protein LTR77_006010 [Saxophila tyrrhenica]|uniref:F-box domain-containing protein n=1 Tax=Saxophila tyrrhenica TaxID=1690608 RepID=A0AAV9P6X3_9PEZI|nr:hypothetical protein LTR77_006010 [Saxophila tyrrhenica]